MDKLITEMARAMALTEMFTDWEGESSSFRTRYQREVWRDRARAILPIAFEAVLPETPSDAVIWAVDKAAHEHWPNARKMAQGMYAAIRTEALKMEKGK